MTVDAPRARALMMVPTVRTPPSAMMGTPKRRAYSATLYTAVPCGRPHAITSWVMQIDPDPIPTRRQSAPASMRFLACAAVTTLPAMTSRSGCVSLMYLINSIWKTELPWDESSTTTSSPTSTSACSRSLSDGRVPTAAPHSSSLVSGCLDASGYSRCFLRSVREMSATTLKSSSTMGSLPLRDFSMSSLASSRAMPSGAVIKSSAFVITSVTCALIRSPLQKSKSREVTIPRSFPPIFPVSVTGKLEYPSSSFISRIFSIEVVGSMQMGSMMKPCLNFFTVRTISACTCAGQLECTIPMPPISAIATAISASVTVSIGDDTSGAAMVIRLVSADLVDTDVASKSM
mmetsp:Transcript_20171/g.52338  ORF Transcript_20171/g.52338 Transcript_20171/m.52338 type:complete len:346 (-) Transcript_20171:349-1386(-)